MQIDNLTPGPFPSGKGSKMRRFALGKRLLPKIQFTFPPSSIWFPFPLGKGLGVRFFGHKLLLLSLLTLTTSCSQVHEKIFTLDCAVGRRPLPGELAPNTAMALDVSTSPIPLLFPAHRAIARCDNTGVVTFDIETPVDTGISQLSTPISTAASHITYAP
jgi:hypothetical protein